MKKKFSITIFFSALTLLLSTNLKAITYYVSPTGNDNSSGTAIDQAWKSIAKINSTTFLPGDIVLFEGGNTFNGGITLDNTDGNNPLNSVLISSYGTGKAIINSGSGNGFYAKNTQGITVSNLIFEGSGMASNTGDGVTFFTDLSGNIKLSKINVKNVEVRNYGKTGISIVATSGNTGFKDVIIDGVHVHHVKKDGIITRGFTMQSHIGWSHINVVIRNTEVDNVTGYADASSHRGSGIILGQVDNGLIEKTAAHHNGSGNTHCGGPGGIWAWDSNNITIQNSESYFNSSGSGCDGLGFDFDGGVTNSLMQYNYSHDNDGAGYLLGQYDYARPWSNNVVRYNISENDGRTNGSGFTLFNGPGSSMSGCKIYNNTVYETPSATNSGVAGFNIIDWYKGITNIEVYNNIFQTTGGAYLVDIPAGYTVKFVGNLYWSTGGTFKIVYQGQTYNTLTAFRTGTGNEKLGSTLTGIVANPNLKNVGNGGTMFPNPVTQLNAYTLGAGSPAIDAGLDLMSSFSINAGAHDFFNNSILAGSADIGAHEVTNITTGIASTDEELKEKASFYPNPVASGNPMFVKGVGFPYSAELVSMTGASVWKENKIETVDFPIPTTTLAAGPYILVVVDNNGRRIVNKMIVQ